MNDVSGAPLSPPDSRALIAVDLGAESCRVSLLRWKDGLPAIELVHRFPNGARHVGDDLRWNLGAIATQVDEGICRAAAIATEGVCSIAVDGWAVDYVRLDANGSPLEEPFCYRDERTVASEIALHQRIPPSRMRELTGVQLLRINTVYQQFADRMKGVPEGQLWLNLPEYMLHRWGGEAIAEYTNATHTQMVELGRMAWCDEIFRAAGLSRNSAPRIVPPGTVVGRLTGPLAAVPGLAEVQLIAPACHDTASAVAGIPAAGADWAYLSSGTWSLIGISLDWPLAHEETARQNYTNLAGAGGRFCFHRNVNGMWLLRQCMAAWSEQGRSWEIVELIEAASAMPKPDGLLNVDEPELWLAGEMPARINRQRIAAGLPAMDEGPAGAAAMASLIFHSLAARYAEVLRQIEEHSGRRLKRLYVVGGGSQNALLNRLTAEATRLEVIRGVPESSTLGNFAVQLTTLEGHRSKERGADADRVAHWAGLLNRVSV
jgi:rhamnulokinase